MENKYNCSPSCNSSDKIVFNNKFEELEFCKNCSLLKKKDLINQKNRVNQLEKFNKDVSHVTQSEYFKTQIIENKSIIRKILSLTKKKPNKILDYGCGYGVFMFASKDLEFEVSGYDINPNFTENLNDKFETFKSEHELLNKENLKKFDLIICRKVLQLSKNLYDDFDNFNSLLSQSGHLVIMDQVKNYSKYKSIISENIPSHSHLLTIQTLNFYANTFKLNTKYLKNDFGDLMIIFERKNKKYTNRRISIKTLQILEKISFVFFIAYKIKMFFKNFILRILK